MLKVLYYGGQKSGKSRLAEKKALELASKKPYYVATYNNSHNDSEMVNRIEQHRRSRGSSFITIEEQRDLVKVVREGETYLIDCISMWILNSLDRAEGELLLHIMELGKLEANIIFVLNNVNEGVIPLDRESRKFVDLTGIIGQQLAQMCDEVYEVKLGLEIKLK